MPNRLNYCAIFLSTYLTYKCGRGLDTHAVSPYTTGCPFCVAILLREGYGLDVRGIVFLFPASAEGLSRLQIIQNSSGITQPPGAISLG